MERVRLAPSMVGAASSGTSTEGQMRTRSPTKKQTREAENVSCIGGLRSPWRAVQRLPELRRLGKVLREIFEKFTDAYPQFEDLPDGGEVAAKLADSEIIDELRRQVAQAVGATGTGRCESGSPWRRELVEAHIKASRDPETGLPQWLREGAPIGVAREVRSCGIFPRIDPDARKQAADAEELLSVEAARGNYKSFEDAWQHAMPEVERIISEGYATDVGRWGQVVEKFGKVAVSKLACIVKERRDGSTKARLVVDLKRSGVNRCVQLEERVVLPRIKEVLEDSMHLLAHAQPGEEVEAMVADFKDAFHTLPAHPDERKFGIARTFGDRFIAFETIMFGGEASPLVWGRAAAYLTRGAQALFGFEELLCECYVDDPIILVLGGRRKRRRLLTIFLLWMCVLGLPMSWGKVARGRQVEWCGAEIRLVSCFVVHAPLGEAFIREFRGEVSEALARPLVRQSKLRRLAGRAAWATGLVPTIRSFIDALWAVLAEMAKAEVARAAEVGQGRRKKVLGRNGESAAETSRVALALRWLRAFLDRKVGDGGLGRTADVREWFCMPDVVITCDASPWGLGATLEVGGWYVAYLRDMLGPDDAEILGIEVGSCKCQAVAEALAMAVAIRTWLPTWGLQRTAVKVRSDSQAALGALGKLASPSVAINRIAREVSLDIACSRYGVDVWEHLAGSANEVADALSRASEPGTRFRLPGALAAVPRSEVEKRDRAWWLADGTLEAAEATCPAGL